ncbi:hypothetical protein [Gracilibacillus thailandensis]|uniref:Uncharacterized protein n=1 Tax=Gracilibacillus thailandensis TaxID=563735 RepID=A0A6N7QW01_9BACI|nr:hypothetical protein [Gracilibacillus thailandensis]MRI65141.1 hypothetical protein [Gracilibacillus thailandensis]
MPTVEEKRWHRTQVENNKLTGHNHLLREKMRTIATITKDERIKEIAMDAIHKTARRD